MMNEASRALNEDVVVARIYSYLKEFLDLGSRLEIGIKKKVFIGCTAGTVDGRLRLLFQSAEQDIVVYLSDDKKEPYQTISETKLFRVFSRSFPRKKFIIPFVIYEAKYRGVNTHTVRHYSEIARAVKHVFPFCHYNLLLVGMKATGVNVDKINLAAKSFDKVLQFPQYNPKNIAERLKEDIDQHIHYLRNEKYHRLTEVLGE